MRTILRLGARLAVAALMANAGGLGAQGRKTGDDWSVYHAIDSSFVVLFPAGGPEGFLRQVAGPVTEFYYFDNSGSTALALHEWSQPAGTKLAPVADFDEFCTSCLGKVIADSTVRPAPGLDRWVYIEGGNGAAEKTISVHRLLTVGSRRFLLQATSKAGQPISKYAEWYLETFAACQPWVPCNPGGAAPKNGVVAQAPLGALLPTVRGKEVDRAPEPNKGDHVVTDHGPKHAVLLPGSPAPLYPEALKYDNLKGHAVLSFVVDTTGRVDSTSFKTVETTHPLFAVVAKDAVMKMRFIPAEIGGKKVREQIEQRFTFDRWNPEHP